MVQINLLPDVKREYLKSQQVKHLFIMVAIVISIIAVSVLTLLYLYVQIAQPRHQKNIQSDIDKSITELKNKDNAVKIVTVQGVLEQIPGLEDKEMVTSRLFEYLNYFTPKTVSYSAVRLDFATGTLDITGQTSSLEETNVLANNLKSAKFTYTENNASQSLQPFSGVIFTSLGKSPQAVSGKTVSFQINFKIDPTLFKQSISNQKITVNAASEELVLPTAKPFSDTSGATQ